MAKVANKKTARGPSSSSSSRQSAAGTFDSATLDKLRNVEEIRIETASPGTKTKHRATIWVVVVEGEVFVRSFTGPKGKWYRNVMANPEANLEVEGKTIQVKAIPVSDQKSIEAVSQAYLEKYGGSPYAKDMVRPEVAPTTLLLEPR